jgi:hypothetical protein
MPTKNSRPRWTPARLAVLLAYYRKFGAVAAASTHGIGMSTCYALLRRAKEQERLK